MIGVDDPDAVADEEDEESDEDEEELEGEWELDPNDPSHPDHDLSISSSYLWEPPAKPLYLRRGVIVGVTVLVILGLLLPVLARIY
jgi:hypothetical protein